jgi:hypothetical protein
MDLDLDRVSLRSTVALFPTSRPGFHVDRPSAHGDAIGAGTGGRECATPVLRSADSGGDAVSTHSDAVSLRFRMGSLIKKRRKRMRKKKHRKLLKRTRVQRRNKK